MKTRFAIFLAALAIGALPLAAQSAGSDSNPDVRANAHLRSDEELDELLGPIALYPDALIAVILPAATKPVDIVMAVRYLQQGGSSARIAEQPWDESVRALAHHRETLEWLDSNLLWTRDLAEAFAVQPDDVMRSIQRLRRAAYNAGTLRNTDQHKLIVNSDEIRIVPADPERIYAPRYDTRVVYVERPVYHSRPVITFGVGYSIGSWLRYDCDWRHRRIYVIDHGWDWHSHHHWRHSRFHHGPAYEPFHWRVWNAHPGFHHPPHYSRPDRRDRSPRHVTPPPAHRPSERDIAPTPDHRRHDPAPRPEIAHRPMPAPEFGRSIRRIRPEYRDDGRVPTAAPSAARNHRQAGNVAVAPRVRTANVTPPPVAAAPRISHPAPRASAPAPRVAAPPRASVPPPSRSTEAPRRDDSAGDAGPRGDSRAPSPNRPHRFHER